MLAFEQLKNAHILAFLKWFSHVPKLEHVHIFIYNGAQYVKVLGDHLEFMSKNTFKKEEEMRMKRERERMKEWERKRDNSII